MAAPQRCPKRRESLMGSIPRRRPSATVSQSLKFYKCVLENRDAPLSSILVCASKGGIEDMRLGHLQPTHRK